MPQYATCHPDRKHDSHGLCGACAADKRRGGPPKYRQRHKSEPLIGWLLRNRSEPTATGCRLWLRGKNVKGYGVFGCPTKSAHRTIWSSVHGPIPSGMLICHSCDTPSCCEITHLFLGTPADNMIDCATKGRRPKGDQHWKQILKAEDIPQIRQDTANGISQGALARRYGVHQSTICNVVKRKTWNHIP